MIEDVEVNVIFLCESISPSSIIWVRNITEGFCVMIQKIAGNNNA